VVAYHSALVFGVLGVSTQGNGGMNLDTIAADAPQPIRDLADTHRNLTVRNVLEAFHDSQQTLETVMTLFGSGYLSLEERALAENLYFAICHKIRRLTTQLDYVPEELQGLDPMLSDTYFCNFSLFQSMPDSWAIKQLFPVMPIHRLNECPTRHAVLGDITCDSDGKIDQFIDRRDVRRTLRLHEFNGQPYYLGAFLIGAYQEILGDLHNLFGDTNTVHVDLNENGDVILEEIVKGETVSEVLDYVQFHDKDLIHRLQSAVERAVREGLIDHQQAGRFVRFYEDGLDGYTYLEEAGE